MDLAPYLAASDWIDHEEPSVKALARRLRGDDAGETARRCFEWVRDEVRHAGDHRLDVAGGRASDTLRTRVGWCFGKAHLLAALLRANGLPAGLAYQRLSIEGEVGPYALHGLVAVLLPAHGWLRVDPRGNKAAVDAQFTPPVERLAFSPSHPGEADLPGLYASPHASVVACFAQHSAWRDVLEHLPDVEVSTRGGSDATGWTALP